MDVDDHMNKCTRCWGKLQEVWEGKCDRLKKTNLADSSQKLLVSICHYLYRERDGGTRNRDLKPPYPLWSAVSREGRTDLTNGSRT